MNVTQAGWDTARWPVRPSRITANMYNLANDLDRAVGALVDDLRASGDLDSDADRDDGRVRAHARRAQFARRARSLPPRHERGDARRRGAAAAAPSAATRRARAPIVDPGWSEDRAIYPDDIAATIYSALGIDWTKSDRRYARPAGAFTTSTARSDFKPVEEIWG